MTQKKESYGGIYAVSVGILPACATVAVTLLSVCGVSPDSDDEVTMVTGFKAGRKKDAEDPCSCTFSRVDFSFESGSRSAKYTDSMSSEANTFLHVCFEVY